MANKIPPLRAQDKLVFLLALVPYLMDRDRVSVAEAAQHFGVPEQQIRDAVRLIAVSGIPGETATYQAGDLFDIAWDDFEDNDQIVLTHLVAIDDSPRFSAREASALIAGLQYLSSLPEHADREAIATLTSKLSRGASAAPTAVAVESSALDETLALIRESVAAGTQIEFDYRNSRGESERRRIDPLRVESVDADWYVRGWCHSREDVRTFRLDRISKPAITSEAITHTAGDVNLPETLFDTSDKDIEVSIELAPSAIGLLGDYVADDAPRVASGDRVRTTVRVPHFHGLKRLISGLPGVVTVVSPPEAREAVARWAQAGAEQYAEEQ
ncbi:YafY family protein [Salinibacterium sp. SWN1162]|uniref:helix-turn-helix transcriptional regulator n=1 Tax=Salinibacterium sp. SWN1162 TaxID=2792053 RepID=UPI0018CD2085|nr:WYL domain-containing protein [Salinibacterium sp. SWN1162]MBH0009403.1 WYL domain-containing protein [Salinibacterium sp. SWN1162]